MTRATLIIAAIAFLCSAAAPTSSPVTFESPCSCHDNHGKARLAVKNVIAEFPMKFTLTNSKGASSGTLQMTVRVKSQADAWQVVGIQKKVSQAAKAKNK